nr:trehalose-phosphatase [uncultured Cohaesibacter sp.]
MVAQHPPARMNWTTHALFLDFDGVLSPIVDRPEEAVMSPDTVRLVEDLTHATDGAIAFISGRALDNLRQVSGNPSLFMSGSHGLELQRPDGTVETLSDSSSLEEPYRDLSTFAQEHGLLLEQKPGALALHYRGREALEEACRSCVDRVASRQGLRALHGNKVCEVALEGIDKGVALDRLMDMPLFKGKSPVMIGDDVTDEDGFRAAQTLGGFGLRIGGEKTTATYHVRTMEDAHEWLRKSLEAP